MKAAGTAVLFLASMMAVAPALSMAQDVKPSINGPTPKDDVSTIPVDKLLPMTVHEAWLASGRDEDKFFSMVRQLADFSAHKRNVTIPESAAAGQRAGAEIKRQARKDPDQLLYAVVDSAVVTVTAKKPATATAKSTK